VLVSYAERLNSDNELIQMQAARSWSGWIARCSTLHPNQSVVDHYLSPRIAIALARLQCYYFSNEGFLAQNEILKGMEKLSAIPGVLVHGRYDMISPLSGALELQKAWKGSEIHIIRDAGHSIAEPAIVDALLNSTSKLLDRFDPQIA
jgi:proline iminopeptidase